MIRQIKQQLNKQSTPNSTQTKGDLNYTSVEEQSVSSLPSLTDGDYEFLFNQLLEGVAHGWHSVKVAKFFQRLEERGQQQLWIAWLESYRAKILAGSDFYQQQLGARMIRLGEISQSISSIKQIGATAYQIGKEVLYGNNPNLVWEYNGADLPPVDPEAIAEETTDSITQPILESISVPEVDDLVVDLEPLTQEVFESNSLVESPSIDYKPQEEVSLTAVRARENEENLVASQSNLAKNEPIESPVLAPEKAIDLSWQQFTELIEKDEHLVEQIAAQFNLTDKDPQSIIKAVNSQLNEAESASIDESTLKLVESWFDLGLKQASAGDLDEAIVSWEKALELNPNLAEAWHNRGSALGRLNNYPEALASFEQTLKIDPHNAQAWNERGHVLYQLEQWQGAVDSWERAIALVSNSYQFWYNRGCALEELQQYQEAIASYEKALEIKPDFQLARSRYTSLLGNRRLTN